MFCFFFFSSRRRHTRSKRDWSSDVCSSDLKDGIADPAHLTIGGYSYGGYMTNWLITQTDRFKAAVTGAGAVEHAANWGNEDRKSVVEGKRVDVGGGRGVRRRKEVMVVGRYG